MADKKIVNEKVTDATREADRDDADARPGADRMPTAEEERLAEQRDVNPVTRDTESAYNEMAANAKGEGRIEQ